MATKYTVTDKQGHSVMFVDVPLDLSLFQDANEPTLMKRKPKAKKKANAKKKAVADAQKTGGK